MRAMTSLTVRLASAIEDLSFLRHLRAIIFFVCCQVCKSYYFCLVNFFIVFTCRVSNCTFKNTA